MSVVKKEWQPGTRTSARTQLSTLVFNPRITFQIEEYKVTIQKHFSRNFKHLQWAGIQSNTVHPIFLIHLCKAPL